MSVISLGSTVSDRASRFGIYGSTILFFDSPCDGNGTIDTLSIYVNTTFSNLKIGIFTGSGTTRTCTGFYTVGTANAGLNTYTGLNLTAVTGDIIGLYAKEGRIESDVNVNCYHKSGDQTGAGSQVYAASDGGGQASIKGTGTSLMEISITDTLNLTESITTLRDRIVSVTDNVTLAEPISAIKALTISVIDTLHLTETVSTLRSRVLSVVDTLGLSEVATLRKKIRNVAKNISTWASNAKNSSIWTNKPKA